MGDAYLHPCLQLTLIPSLPSFRRYSGGQNFDSNALAAQDVLQPLGDVAFLCVDREDLHSSSLVKLGFDLFQQPAFLRVNEVLVEVRWIRDYEPFALTGFWIHRMAVERSKCERSVRVKHERIQTNAHNGLVTAMLLERCLDVFFEALVGCRQNGVHLDGEHLLFVRRQRVRDVLDRYKGTELHQKPAEEQRRSSRAR